MMQWSANPDAALAGDGPQRFCPQSGEPKRLTLLRPGEWQAGIGGELLCGEAGGLAAFKNGARDIRVEKGQAQQQRYIGRAQLLPRCQIGDSSAGARAQLLLLAMRANEQFDQLGIRLAGYAGSQGCIDDQPLALADSAQPRRDR